MYLGCTVNTRNFGGWLRDISIPDTNVSTQEHEILIADRYFQRWKHPPSKSFSISEQKLRNGSSVVERLQHALS